MRTDYDTVNPLSGTTGEPFGEELPVWTTKDGRKIPVSEMTDEHLTNAYLMLKQKGFVGNRTLRCYLSRGPTADGALVAFEAEQRAVFDSPFSEFVDHFNDELLRRGLQVPK